MTQLGQLIRARRRERDMTQTQLSEASGIGVTHICQIEKGKRNPSVDALKLLATGLGVPVGELVDAVDTRLAILPNLGNIDLRDWFAGMAMQGFLAGMRDEQQVKHLPKAAYAVADAMVKARLA